MNLKKIIINAIKSKDVEKIVLALKKTNLILTNIEGGDFSERGIKGLRKKIVLFLTEYEKKCTAFVEVYLGDYGYAKMYIGRINNDEEIIILLETYSNDEVKTAWGKNQ